MAKDFVVLFAGIGGRCAGWRRIRLDVIRRRLIRRRQRRIRRMDVVGRSSCAANCTCNKNVLFVFAERKSWSWDRPRRRQQSRSALFYAFSHDGGGGTVVFRPQPSVECGRTFKSLVDKRSAFFFKRRDDERWFRSPCPRAVLCSARLCSWGFWRRTDKLHQLREPSCLQWFT